MMYNKNMTLKQKRATELLVGNGGNVTKAMIGAGYSPATANTPQKLTESKGFEELKKEYREELMAQGIHSKKLAIKMAEWIDAVKISTSLTEPDRITPDYQTQLKAGEMLREDFGFKEVKNQVNILNQGDMSLEFIGK